MSFIPYVDVSVDVAIMMLRTVAQRHGMAAWELKESYSENIADR